MDKLTGVGDPFHPDQAVTVLEYDHNGGRRELSSNFDILFDDSIAAIGSKLLPAGPGAWWIRRHADASEIQAMIHESDASSNDLLSALVPEADKAERKRIRSSGGVIHICPYLKGVFNASVQSKLRVWPAKVHRQPHNRATLWSLTQIPQIHFISAQEIQKSLRRSVAGIAPPQEQANALVNRHPRIPQGLDTNSAALLTSTELGVKLDQVADAGFIFSDAKLSKECVAIAQSDPGGEAFVRVSEEALREAAIDLDSLRHLVVPPRPAPCVAIPVANEGTLIVESPDDITFVCEVQVPASIPASWKRAVSICTKHLSLPVDSEADPEIRFVSMTVSPPTQSRLDPRKLVRTVQQTYSKYVDAAIASDGVVECVYLRSPGPFRAPACVENALAKHVRGQRSLDECIETIVKSHAVSEPRARAMADQFDIKQFRNRYPASVRVTHTNGTRMHVSGTIVGDVHRLMVVAMMAVLDATSHKSPMEAQNKQEKRAAPANIAEIIQAAEAESAGEADDEKQEAREGQSNNTGLFSLLSADPKLFQFKSETARGTYARSCGPHRQPIAVRDDELKSMGKDAPKSKKAGPRRLNYICPEVWCEASRTAMTREDAAKKGWRCPDGSKAVDMMAASWWRNASTRHVGFLKTSLHPDGFQMPCCFKTFGKMQRERQHQLGDGETPTSDGERDALDKSGRYIMSAKEVPLERGRQGRVDLGERASKAGVVRVGVNQRRNTFLEAMAVIENSTLSDVKLSLLSSLTPTCVASAASGGVMAYLVSRYPTDFSADDAAVWLRQYAQKPKGRQRLERHGMLSRVMTQPISASDPDMAREMVIARGYLLAVRVIEKGDNANTRITQLLVLAALGKRYPEISRVGQETFISCIRWDRQLRSGTVAGVLHRDGPYLEPLVGTSREMLQEVTSHLSASCGALVRSRNNTILEFLNRNGHLVAAQVCDESHVMIGVVLEGNLFVPFPEPHVTDLVLPLVYQSALECADGSWTPGNVRKLFEGIAKHCSESLFSTAVYGKHCVCVGDYVVPLKGGSARMAETRVSARVRAVQQMGASPTTRFMELSNERSRVVRGIVDNIIANHHHAYVLITSTLSPLSADQRQQLFESIAPDFNKALALRYTDVMRTNRSEEMARPGEVFLTDQDLVDGTAEFVVNAISAGADSAFRSVHQGDARLIVDPHPGLDVRVQVPASVSERSHLEGACASLGSIYALEHVVGLAGGVYGRLEHGRAGAHRASLHWKMTGQLLPDWPAAARPLLQRLASKNKSDGAWERLVAIGRNVDITDDDIVVAFSGLPVQLELHKHGTKSVRRKSPAVWLIITWRSDRGVSFALRHGSPLIPLTVTSAS